MSAFSSASSPASPSLPPFVSLAPRISLYTPPTPTTGHLIILCTWLGAAPKHIAKYTSVYQRIAPHATILKIESAVPILVSSYARQRAAIEPAVKVVLGILGDCAKGERGAEAKNPRFKIEDGRLIQDDEVKDECNRSARSTTAVIPTDNAPSPKILLHMFSNGGTNSATQFLFVLNERLCAPLPLHAMLYDSCPAKGTYWKDHRAMVFSLPKDIFSLTLGNIIIHIILILLHTEIACGLENPSSLLRRTLLDENKIRGEDFTGAGELEKVTRHDNERSKIGSSCYLYSKSDQMVDWTDIRDHAAEARSKGWDAEEIVFEGSNHCGHFQVDEQRYVDAMERMWRGNGREGSSTWRSKL